jgi:hypothetical protein
MTLYLLILILLLIFVQDLRQRAVYWFLFPLLLLAGLWYKWNGLQLEMIKWNALFVVFCLLMLTLYVSFKEKTLTPIWKDYFSWGDIFYLIAVIPILPFYSFLMYFTLGTILTLFIHTITLLKNGSDKTIPYAGYMAVTLIPVLLLENKLNQWIIERL